MLLFPFSFDGHNYSHIIVGLAGGSLVQVFQEMAGQACRLTKVREGIWNLEVVLAIARLLFAKDTVGSLTNDGTLV